MGLKNINKGKRKKSCGQKTHGTKIPLGARKRGPALEKTIS